MKGHGIAAGCREDAPTDVGRCARCRHADRRPTAGPGHVAKCAGRIAGYTGCGGIAEMAEVRRDTPQIEMRRPARRELSRLRRPPTARAAVRVELVRSTTSPVMIIMVILEAFARICGFSQ